MAGVPRLVHHRPVEIKLRRIVDLIDSGLDLFQAEARLDAVRVAVDDDEYMRTVTIGAPKRVDGPIHLADADPGLAHAVSSGRTSRIQALLGGLVFLLGHFGSSVRARLAAKPARRRPAGVADPAGRRTCPRYEASGYVPAHPERLAPAPAPEGPGADMTCMSWPATSSRSSACSRSGTGSHARRQRRRFRTPSAELAARRSEYVQQYANAEGEVVEAVIRPGPSTAPGLRDGG